MIETIRNKDRENYQIMSNYRYFGIDGKKKTQNLNQTRIKGSLSFDMQKIWNMTENKNLTYLLKQKIFLPKFLLIKLSLVKNLFFIQHNLIIFTS